MTTPQLFGTDGIRAHYSATILRPENMTRLGRIFAHGIKQGLFSGGSPAGRPLVVIGRDTRASGPYLENALLAGLCASGIDCQLLGVVPTSVVAHFTKSHGAALGIMISASHNPYYDNGVKLFDSMGFKITEAHEAAIAHDYFNFDEERFLISPNPGEITQCHDAKERYADVIMSALTEKSMSTQLRVVVDCAHGAASGLAQKVFTHTGATVISIGDHAHGKDINRDCGSEAPAVIKREVIKAKADLGIAFDGDADRVIFVDETGELIDGDAILATLARDFHQQHQLAHNTLVATVMSSVALDDALAPYGIKVVRTTVGDKFVARAMLEGGFTFGGENSGHLITFPHATTGDGILSALKFITIMNNSGLQASRLVSFYQPTPKILRNIIIDEKIPLDDLPRTLEAIQNVNGQLNSRGRVMLRYSGTENKARLLVEAPTQDDCARIAQEIGEAFLAEIATVKVRHTRTTHGAANG